MHHGPFPGLYARQAQKADGIDGGSEEEPEEGTESGNACFCQDIEIHVMGMEDGDARLLYQFIVYGIYELKRPPADSQHGMVPHHLQSSQPHIHAHGYRRVGTTVIKN